MTIKHLRSNAVSALRLIEIGGNGSKTWAFGLVSTEPPKVAGEV